MHVTVGTVRVCLLKRNFKLMGLGTVLLHSVRECVCLNVVGSTHTLLLLCLMIISTIMKKPYNKDV